MAQWTGDRIDLELGQVREVRIRIIGGDASITVAPGPVRVEGEVVEGEPLEVELTDGILVVEQPTPRPILGLVGGARATCTVAVTVPDVEAVSVATVSADVVLGGVAGRVETSTVSGTQTLTGLRGDLSIRTVSGQVEAQRLDGTLTANAVSGALTVAGGLLDRLTARTVSGDLTFDLDAVPDGSLTSVSGDIALRVPDGRGVELDVTTVSGRLDSAFPLVGEDRGRRHLRGRVGDGSRRLAVRTTSGDFALLRRASTSDLVER
ncbi:MAG TPA: DUF4097 family beta strand repeat-containing protein [Acidimicrobiales bacterium]|nr:DUF4097 family beta strand repeat-containing protein [Acidimicrobiales bacterium]